MIVVVLRAVVAVADGSVRLIADARQYRCCCDYGWSGVHGSIRVLCDSRGAAATTGTQTRMTADVFVLLDCGWCEWLQTRVCCRNYGWLVRMTADACTES